MHPAAEPQKPAPVAKDGQSKAAVAPATCFRRDQPTNRVTTRSKTNSHHFALSDFEIYRDVLLAPSALMAVTRRVNWAVRLEMIAISLEQPDTHSPKICLFQTMEAQHLTPCINHFTTNLIAISA